jgi:hypothetical protein
VNQTPRSPAVSPPFGRAALVAALALALAPSSALAQDPASLVDAEVPHDSAISEQYQRVQAVLDQAAAAVPDAPLAQPAAESAPAPAPKPPAPPPPPSPAPKPDQYHSENVSVTQQQPSNVNVSIRINSPGDDGPVVQINNAGGTTQVEQVAQPPPAPEPATPAAPAGGELPETWEWVWTSACFGGAPRAGAATATPGWNWRWSCDEAGGGADENVASGIGAVPDGLVPDVDRLIAAAVPDFASAPLMLAAASERPRARPDRRRDRPRRSSAPAGGAGPPPAAGGGGPRAGPPPASAHAPPARVVRAHRAVRAEPRARPGDGSNTLPPGGDGPTLDASTALGGVAALLLGIWTAVLATACVIVVPRLRHRRWSGLTWRLPRLPSTRLERPG